MSQTTDAAQTWRDLAHRLPDHLVRFYERQERFREGEIERTFPGEDPAEVLERLQRHLLDEALQQLPFEHIPLPSSAARAEAWQDDGTGSWTRVVMGTRRDVGHMSVGVDGVQGSDGSVRWSMYVDADGDTTTADDARAFSDALLAAADELETLAGGRR
ncbi:hypothetical protein BOH72_23350 [Mycobacterium sp. WY10]|nr:hypothetical protein BOH72_23350 [Mycobacterium sp. WY10]